MAESRFFVASFSGFAALHTTFASADTRMMPGPKNGLRAHGAPRRARKGFTGLSSAEELDEEEAVGEIVDGRSGATAFRLQFGAVVRAYVYRRE